MAGCGYGGQATTSRLLSSLNDPVTTTWIGLSGVPNRDWETSPVGVSLVLADSCKALLGLDEAAEPTADVVNAKVVALAGGGTGADAGGEDALGDDAGGDDA